MGLGGTSTGPVTAQRGLRMRFVRALSVGQKKTCDYGAARGQARGDAHRQPALWRFGSLALLAPALLICVCSATAYARRPATPRQTRAIRRLLERRWRALRHNPCPKGESLSGTPFLRRAFLSDSDPRYAFASIADRHCVFAVCYLMRRKRPHGGRWHVAYQVADSAQACSDFRRHVPGMVLREFALERSHGQCWLGEPFNGL